MKINPGNLQTLGRTFSALYQQGLTMAASQSALVATTVPSSTGENEYGWLGKLPSMREWLGDRVINAATASDYTIKNRDFEQTIGVDRNDIEDDNIGIYSPLFTEMGRSTMAHKEELVFGQLKAGFDRPCYDGQNFFDTDHVVLDAAGNETTVSNMQAGAATPWYLIDDTRALKPIIWQERKAPQFVAKDRPEDDNVFHRKQFLYGVDSRCNVGFGFWQFAFGSKAELTADNYEAAREAMHSMKGDYGRPLGVRPTLLVVPPSLEGEAMEILNAERNAAGATNVWRGTAKLEVVPWLA
ncbi:Mu-like prophage major head subunit gpT family protein [Erythrobacter sp. NE805]|uniref:Mu-like prophage major head subunit gpT family protein n=1 Tax=Erythrobacter sp. NE805 TaxID=3389875 RepID=UPI00396B447E